MFDGGRNGPGVLTPLVSIRDADVEAETKPNRELCAGGGEGGPENGWGIDAGDVEGGGVVIAAIMLLPLCNAGKL